MLPHMWGQHDATCSMPCHEQGWSLQKRCLQRVKHFAEDGQPGHDYLIVLQHYPVFTLGAAKHARTRCSMKLAALREESGVHAWRIYPPSRAAAARRRRRQQRGACKV